jgi:hypothetical protein
MLRALSAIAGLAALVAGVIVLAGSLVQASAPAPVEKSGRADAMNCEFRDWPYYKTGCMRDETRNAGRAKPVRVVSADRIKINQLAEHSPSPEAVERADAISSAQRLRHVSHQIAFETVERDSIGAFAWALPASEVRTYLAAGDFVRRTVR